MNPLLLSISLCHRPHNICIISHLLYTLPSSAFRISTIKVELIYTEIAKLGFLKCSEKESSVVVDFRFGGG